MSEINSYSFIISFHSSFYSTNSFILLNYTILHYEMEKILCSMFKKKEMEKILITIQNDFLGYRPDRGPVYSIATV